MLTVKNELRKREMIMVRAGGALAESGRPGLGIEPALPPNSIFAKRRQRRRTREQN